MAEATPGKQCPWELVPNRALVYALYRDPECGLDDWHGYAARIDDIGIWLGRICEDDGWEWQWLGIPAADERWPWHNSLRWPATVEIVALGLQGNESAEVLQQLAERSAIRRALGVFVVDQTFGVGVGPAGEEHELLVSWGEPYGHLDPDQALDLVASRLQRGGWRPELTPLEAQRIHNKVEAGDRNAVVRELVIIRSVGHPEGVDEDVGGRLERGVCYFACLRPKEGDEPPQDWFYAEGDSLLLFVADGSDAETARARGTRALLASGWHSCLSLREAEALLFGIREVMDGS